MLQELKGRILEATATVTKIQWSPEGHTSTTGTQLCESVRNVSKAQFLYISPTSTVAKLSTK
jgi:hypothetical protein